MSSVLESPKRTVRYFMGNFARLLNHVTKGKLSSNTVTITGLMMHVPIAWLIAIQSYRWAAVLLVIFGLFDTLDGELARLQNRAGSFGMFLDSTTDRMKEIILYIGIAYAFVSTNRPYMAVWAVAACGVSVLVSYINAWGEVTLSTNKGPDHQVNKSLRSGLMGFELRISALILGLLINQLAAAVIVITALSLLTAGQRIVNVTKKLNV